MLNTDLIQGLICGVMMVWVMGSLSWAIFRLCTYRRHKGFPRRYITAGMTAEVIATAQREHRLYHF